MRKIREFGNVESDIRKWKRCLLECHGMTIQDQIQYIVPPLALAGSAVDRRWQVYAGDHSSQPRQGPHSWRQPPSPAPPGGGPGCPLRTGLVILQMLRLQEGGKRLLGRVFHRSRKIPAESAIFPFGFQFGVCLRGAPCIGQ